MYITEIFSVYVCALIHDFNECGVEGLGGRGDDEENDCVNIRVMYVCPFVTRSLRRRPLRTKSGTLETLTDV